MSASTTEPILRATGLLIIEVINSNPNGDPDRESDPRQRPDFKGEISPVSFKRKVRDLIENKDGDVWKQVGGDLKPEEFVILESRGRDRPGADAALGVADPRQASECEGCVGLGI